MKKIVTIGLLVSLLTANLQAAPIVEAFPIPIQKKIVSSVTPVIILELTSLASAALGIFCGYKASSAMYEGYEHKNRSLKL